MDVTTLPAAAGLGGAAFLIAFTGAMAPGPLLTITITETVRRGRLRALMLLGGHALLEALFLVGFAFGLREILQQPRVATALALVGGAFLLWMGGTLLRDVLTRRISLSLEEAGETPTLGPILTGALVSLSNPYWMLWWVTVGASLAAKGLAIGPLGVAAFFVGHELGDIVWYGAVVSAVHSGRRFLNDRVYRAVIGVCATFLVGLGVWFLVGALR